MRRAARKLACVWLTALAAAGCSVLLDPSRFVGDPLQGCVDCDDGGSLDGREFRPDVDTIIEDAQPTEDSPYAVIPDADANVGPDGPVMPKRFCETLAVVPALCRDFDDGKPFDEGFTVVRSAGTELGANAAAFKSAPNSFFAGTTNAQQSHIERIFGVASTKIRIAFDVRMDEVYSVGNGALVAEMALNVGTATEHYVRLMIAASHSVLEVWQSGGTFTNYQLGTTSRPTKGVWGNIDMTIVLSPTPQAILKFNGANAFPPANLPGTWASGTPRISFGLPYVPSTATWRIRQDNLIVEIQ